ncbi:MAG: glutamate 5-kinase [Candidatus Obscuribacterales bacterium]|nr:glutamate 5-kinase [Candidatus Obscuribacterales bacterium]
MSDSAEKRKEILSSAKRVVVKLGTAVLMREEGGIALSRFYSFVEDLARLKKSGKEVLLVTSGAIGLGVRSLGLAKRPKDLPGKQACAAVGQGRLMSLYSDAFAAMDVLTAQVLLTEDDFANRRRYLNLRGTIQSLLDFQALPIINENDTVATAELETVHGAPKKVNFGDNDKLSALVAGKVDADLLLILTDVDGLYTADPRTDKDAKLISIVENLSPEFEAQVMGSGKSGAGTDLGRGGMKTKLEAARVATQSGCATIIAGGKEAGIISKVFSAEEKGTLFLPGSGMAGKLRWIAFATTVSASLHVNEGARSALLNKKASLLPAGVVKVEGQFERGDVVSIVDERGKEFARGIVNYSSNEAQKISGLHSELIDEMLESRNYDAIVTRDNLAILESVISG